MIQIGSKRTLQRLDEMLSSAIDGTFEEKRYDETELSRLENRWKQYFASSKQSLEKTRAERENIKSLVSDISHQTKTPLSNILLYAELLGEKAKDGEEKALAEQIYVQAEKLEFLIQSLVKMSRLESGILEIIPSRQDLTPLVEDSVNLYQAKAAEKDISLLFQITESISASYDRKWTLEALNNVVDNAVKYSPEGSRVEIRIRRFEFYACIEVADEGPGIPEEERAGIFGRFCRGKQVQQEEGVGLGLYLTREILERENGYVKVSARQEGGSCFSLYLPW